MRKINKIWLYILSFLAVLGTYIGINQLISFNSDSYTPVHREPPSTTQGTSTRNTKK